MSLLDFKQTINSFSIKPLGLCFQQLGVRSWLFSVSPSPWPSAAWCPNLWGVADFGWKKSSVSHVHATGFPGGMFSSENWWIERDVFTSGSGNYVSLELLENQLLINLELSILKFWRCLRQEWDPLETHLSTFHWKSEVNVFSWKSTQMFVFKQL